MVTDNTSSCWRPCCEVGANIPDPPRDDQRDRDRAEELQWRLGSGRGEMTEAERDYYQGRRTGCP